MTRREKRLRKYKRRNAIKKAVKIAFWIIVLYIFVVVTFGW